MSAYFDFFTISVGSKWFYRGLVHRIKVTCHVLCRKSTLACNLNGFSQKAGSITNSIENVYNSELEWCVIILLHDSSLLRLFNERRTYQVLNFQKAPSPLINYIVKGKVWGCVQHYIHMRGSELYNYLTYLFHPILHILRHSLQKWLSKGHANFHCALTCANHMRL